MHRSTAAILVLAAFGSAAAVAATRYDDSEAKLAKVLGNYVAGSTTSCIPITYRDLHSEVYGKTILYRPSTGGTIYRNDTAGGCEGAANGDVLVQVELEGRPCSGDIIRTVDSTSRFPTGSCALGQFTVYKRVAK